MGYSLKSEEWFFPFQVGVSLQKVGSYTKVSGKQQTTIPIWESPRKKFTARIIFEIFLLMISNTKLFYLTNGYMLQAGAMQQAFAS